MMNFLDWRSALLVMVLSLSPGVLAQTVESTGPSVFERAKDLTMRGSYLAAIDLYPLVGGADREQALILASRANMMVGQYEQAVASMRDAVAESPNSALLRTELAEVLRATGHSAEALEVLNQVMDEAGETPVRTLVQYGSLLQFKGQNEEARIPLNEALSRYQAGLVFASEEVAMVALAAQLLGQFHDANTLFSEAVRSDPNNLEAQTLWGDLFREKYNNADAEISYTKVLEVNRRYVPAMTGMAQVSEPERMLQVALEVNPRYVPALEAYGTLLLLNDRPEDAREFLTEALHINPESVTALATLAAIAALNDETEEFEELEGRLDGFSPGNSTFYAELADIFGNNYRFQEAVQFARKALEADPTNWRAHNLLGNNLVRLGEEEEGKRHLELAFANDPFNVLTSNLLQVFDTLETYATLESEHFRVNMSHRDAQILWPYLEPLLEESWDELTAKYGYEPEVPIILQVFENTADFAVRSVGLPDIGPLVGICFGKVVTLISPDTLTANWQEIVWHELVHVWTLQMTNNRMPRWLSEGISTWEEHEARPEWGRRQGLDLVRAVREDRLLPVADLNKGFTTAESSADLGFAYFQSYLVVDYIAKVHGFDKLRELVLQYAHARTEDEMFRNVFDMPLDEFNKGFRSWIDQRVEDINVFVHFEDAPDEGAGHGHGIRENSSAVLAELYNNASLKQYMRQRIQSEPRDFQAHLQLGIVLFKEENFQEAETHLKFAHEILPDYSGYPSPPLVLSQMYEKQGRDAEKFEQLEILLQNQQHEYDAALVLANRALENGDRPSAEYYVSRALAVDPYRADVHQTAAMVADQSGDTEAAVREHEILVQLDLNDPVEARTNLAGAYLRNGQAEEARYNVLRALEVAPTYRRAQRLLLEAVEDGPNSEGATP